MIPVILSGGSGTRLWPLSRGVYPKQFLPLVSDKTMVQETLVRLEGIDGLERPIAVCNEEHRFMMAEQLREVAVEPSAIILEPMGKNTAPAVAMAALAANNPEAILLVLPADHVIGDINAFHEAIFKAEQLASKGYLVTFGIVPTAAETGYGYIKRYEQPDNGFFMVEEFVEKPNAKVAQAYIDSGEYFWNSGMFAFKASVYLDALSLYAPEMLAVCELSFEQAKRDEDFIRLDKQVFANCPADSIDYAVMEKTDKALVIPLDADWNDVGSWSSLWDVSEKDEQGNALSGDVIALDTEQSFIHSEHRLVTTVGVKNVVVIETADAVMVTAQDCVQDVKKIVTELKIKNRSEASLHRKGYRPWGHYDSVDNGERYKTKHIVVKPGGKLSMQKHYHRAEHWVVVKGTALVTKGEETLLLSENESTYIPLGVMHRLENPGVIPLEIVEVQSGSYLGEDDIVRYEDKYGRS